MGEERSAVLVVDDDPAVAALAEIYGKRIGFGRIDAAETAAAGLASLAEGRYELVLLDLGLPDTDEGTVLREFLEAADSVPVAVITADDRLETAVRCMREGAFDFIEKPIAAARLISLLSHAAETARLKRIIAGNAAGKGGSAAFSRVLTTSPVMRNLFHAVERVAPSPLPVLIHGESGTGKELIAHAVHELSGRIGEFVPVNTGGLDGSLFSDVLFGHVKGAYTGADGYRSGLAKRAAAGTLFLDEIGDIGAETQVKLLRFIQNGEYYPLGADAPERSECRFVFATNVDLYEAVRSGRFRADLFYRLTVHTVSVPPLRDRKEDLPLLTEHFAREAAEKLKLQEPVVGESVRALLASYDFPGNIRELSAMIYGAFSASSGNRPSLAYLRDYIERHRRPRDPSLDAACAETSEDAAGPFPRLEEVEMRHIRDALRRTGGNQSAAAALLGISQSTISRKLSQRTMQNG